MTGNTTTSRQEKPAPPTNPQDVFVTRFANPHTAIPDWLLRTRLVRPEIRHMAITIIVLSKHGIPPTKQEIAEELGVEPRTVQRYLAKLKEAQIMSFQLVGKKRLYVFHEPPTIIDPLASDPPANDPMGSYDTGINDRWDTHAAENGSTTHGSSSEGKPRSFRERISDRSGGGGISDSPTDSELPTTSAAKPQKVHPTMIKSETARWLVRVGFNISSAYRFKDLPLAVAQADHARRRALGQGNGAIINAWSVELPEFDLANDQGAGPVPQDRRAELQAKYGDLFMFSGDELPPESEVEE